MHRGDEIVQHIGIAHLQCDFDMDGLIVGGFADDEIVRMQVGGGADVRELRGGGESTAGPSASNVASVSVVRRKILRVLSIKNETPTF